VQVAGDLNAVSCRKKPKITHSKTRRPVIVIAALVGLYFVGDLVMGLKLGNETRAMKAAGYATTIAEVKPLATPGGREAARFIMAAYDTTPVSSSSGPNRTARKGKSPNSV
jgi:hypothetical protein